MEANMGYFRCHLPGKDGFYAIVRALIRSGCELDVASEDPWRLLHCGFSIFLGEKRDVPIWEDPPSDTFHWASFLCSLGLNVNHLDAWGYTPLADQVSELVSNQPESYENESEVGTGTVFMLCLLRADTSIREPVNGAQALHQVFRYPYSAEKSSCVSDLAYILIRYGGADVSVLTYDGYSPTLLAFRNGWWEELKTVLDRCGIDVNALVEKDIQLMLEYNLLNGGKSTAVDTDDLVSNHLWTVTKRKAIIGDRLED